MKAISHPAERVIVAPCTAKRSQAPASSSFSFSSFFFTLALRRPRPIPSLPSVRLCLSPVFVVRITCYADTSHYYSQGRTGRRTDICKLCVMQYASVRESEIGAHNQSVIDRFALTISSPSNQTLNSSELFIHIISKRCIFRIDKH